MKTRFLRWGLMLGLPVMAAVAVFTLSAFTNAAGDEMCPAVDPLGHTVLLPNPADCSSFYSCSEGVPILMHCPDGLHFNDKLDVCDWPQDAGCSDDNNKETKCSDHNYVPNRYMTATPNNTTTTSDADGNISVAGKVSGGYARNTTYDIMYEVKNCDGEQEGACCDQREIGVRIVKATNK